MHKLRDFLILVLILGVLFFIFKFKNEKKVEAPAETVKPATSFDADPKNLAYIVDGEIFNLKNGYAEIPVADSVMKNSLTLFGDVVVGDLDKDSDKDGAVWLVNEPGGTGRFYYAALVINHEGKYKATDAMFLGDRIAPQNINIVEGRAVYNFAERNPDEPFTAEPSIGRSIWVNYDAKANEIGEWVRNFEGESNLTETDTKNEIENYLKENIGKLSPVKSVLGGNWYVVKTDINLNTNSGMVTYEDGHIQEKRNFEFTLDKGGKLIKLEIR